MLTGLHNIVSLLIGMQFLCMNWFMSGDGTWFLYDVGVTHNKLEYGMWGSWNHRRRVVLSFCLVHVHVLRECLGLQLGSRSGQPVTFWKVDLLATIGLSSGGNRRWQINIRGVVILGLLRHCRSTKGPCKRWGWTTHLHFRGVHGQEGIVGVIQAIILLAIMMTIMMTISTTCSFSSSKLSSTTSVSLS